MILKKSAIDIVMGKDWGLLEKKIEANKKFAQRISFNIASISTYTGHLENYHSDVWGFLLDPRGEHKRGNLFLNLFLDYLVAIKVISKDEFENFANCEVLREKGRIDVCIVDHTTGSCIIIENKINNAIDQIRQIDRYYENAIKQFKVAATLYVSLHGNRQAKLESGANIASLAVCDLTTNNFLEGWLQRCKLAIPYDGTEATEDIRSFLHQYCLLVQHLAASQLKIMSSQLLYEFLDSAESMKTALLIERELENVKFYRNKVFADKMGSNYYSPFKSQTYYSKEFPNHLIFKNWVFKNKLNFQLDIVHFKDRTEFRFYEVNGKMNVEETEAFLKQVTKLNDFTFKEKIGNNNHFWYAIRLADGFSSLTALDERVAEYSSELFKSMTAFELATT